MQALRIARRLLPGDGREVHRQHHAGLGKLVDANGGARGSVLSHHFHLGAVHFVEIRHPQQKHVDVHDMLEIRIHGLEHHLERLEDSPGLGIRVGANELTARGIEARCAADSEEFTDL